MKLETSGSTLLVRPDKDLDHYYASIIREKIDSCIKSGTITKVIFDFSQVDFMDSSGIGIIMGRYRLINAINGSIGVFGLSNRLEKILTMAGLKRIINIYKSENEALLGEDTNEESYNN